VYVADEQDAAVVPIREAAARGLSAMDVLIGVERSWW